MDDGSERAGDIAAALARWVHDRPDHAAIIDADDTVVTYAQLWDRARRLADELDVGSGEIVGVRFGRGIDVVVAMLAVLLAGAVYSPLSPDDPDERTDALRTRLGLRTVLVADGHGGITTRSFDVEPPLLPMTGPTGERPAYVVWTSGSTGAPKAVIIPQRGVLRLVRDRSFMDLGPDDRVLFASNPMFDATTWEVWATLGNGGTVVVVETADLVDVERLRRRLEHSGVTCAFLTTSLHAALTARDPAMFGSLRSLAVGGEPVRPHTIRAVMESAHPPGEVLDVYGPTECTTYATASRVEAADLDGERLSIGRALHAVQLVVTDADGHEIDPGVEGELWIGGDGVALGYLVADRLEEDPFVTATFDGRTATRWYRTGDLVRVDERGRIDCLGRIDRQVKIRGYRVEPSEIERHIDGCDGVSASAVVARRSDGGTRLSAYVVVTADDPASPASIRSTLQSRLPSYMVPSRIFIVEELPVTANGKLDVDALVAAGPAAGAPDATVTDPDPSGDHDELTTFVLDGIRRVLADPSLGPDDDVWDAGFDSLAFVELSYELSALLGRELRSIEVVERPTAASLAALLRSAMADARSSSIEFGRGGTEPPLFLLTGGGTTALALRDVAVEFARRDRPVVIVEPRGVHVPDRPDRRVEPMARHFVSEIMRRRPSEPVLLGGWSSGGVVATYAAWLLEQQGIDVRLVLIDTRFFVPRRRTPNFRSARRAYLERRVRSSLATPLHRARQSALGRRIRRQIPVTDLAEFTAIHERALMIHRAPPPLHSPVVHLHFPGSPCAAIVADLLPGSLAIETPGDHHSMLQDPNATLLVDRIDNWLRGQAP